MEPSTGLPGLDAILKGLMPGDNIVLEVDSLDDYRYFVDAFRRQPAATTRPFIYFRFARHPALIPEDCGVEVVRLHPDEGFESMVWEIHHTIDRCGDGALYVFDSLSELATDWNSDQMVGNFFRLTCPYLYERNTIAYFALLRDMHSDRVLQPITDTTQLFLGIYNHRGRMFVHPYKVAHRYSPTMYMLHESRNGGAEFRPILDSGTIAEVMAEKQLAGLNPTRTQYSSWDRVFLEAEVLLEARNSGNEDREAIDAIYNRIARMMFSRDERMLELASRHLKLEDLLRVRNRMIGTGLIGGKAVGMLIARAVLRSADPRLEELLEPHDSFHIGSDVFYTYLVQNGCWSVREKQRNPERYLEGAEEARRRILTGTFPEYYNNQLRGLLKLLSGSRRSSCAPAHCWKTTTATRSPGCTTAGSAPTRGRSSSGSRTCSTRSARSTPVRCANARCVTALSAVCSSATNRWHC